MNQAVTEFPARYHGGPGHVRLYLTMFHRWTKMDYIDRAMQYSISANTADISLSERISNSEI